MVTILSSTLPVFLLVIAGFLAVRHGLFPESAVSALGSFVVRIALPVLLFHSLSQKPLAELFSGRYLAAYGAGSVLMFGLGLAWSSRVRGQPLERAAFVGLGMANANSAYIGYPVLLQMFGPIASTVLALCALIENIIVIPLSLAISDSASATHEPFHRALGRAIARLRQNPIIVGIFAGCLAALVHLHVPDAIDRAATMLSAATAPIALFVIGGNLVGLRLAEVRQDAPVIAAAKLLLHPLAVAGFMFAFGPADPLLRAGAIIIASAPMLSIYPILGARHGLERMCAAALLLATPLSFLTMSATIWLLGHYDQLPH
jgi:malonate transporter and related proteins